MTPRKPQRALTAGAALVASIVEEMREDGLEPDARERALLATAARLADRIETLEAIVEREGLMVTSPNGVVKTHPAAVESRACSVALPRVLGGVALSDTSGKDPAKVRAAQTRWRGAQRGQGRVLAAAGCVMGRPIGGRRAVPVVPPELQHFDEDAWADDEADLATELARDFGPHLAARVLRHQRWSTARGEWLVVSGHDRSIFRKLAEGAATPRR